MSQRELIEALVGREHAELYHTSASFHAAVHTLASMLPAMVGGLAEEAQRQDARSIARARGPVTPPRLGSPEAWDAILRGTLNST